MHTGTIYLLILLGILDLILLNADTYYSINRTGTIYRLFRHVNNSTSTLSSTAVLLGTKSYIIRASLYNITRDFQLQLQRLCAL